MIRPALRGRHAIEGANVPTSMAILPQETRPPRASAWLISSAVSLNLLALALPLVMLQIFERVIPHEAHATLALMFLALCGVALLECLLRIAQGVLAAHDGAAHETRVATFVARRTLRAVPRDFERETTGAHLERFGAIAQTREAVTGPSRLVAIDAPFAVLFIGLIAVIGGWLALVPVVMVALLLVASLVSRRWQSRVTERRKTVDGRRFAFLIEFLSDIATVKSNCMEAQMTRRYEMLAKQSLAASRNLVQAAGVMQGFSAVIGQGAVAAMGLAGAGLVITNAIGLGELAACMLLNGRAVQPLVKMIGLIGQDGALASARRRISDLAAVPQRGDPSEGAASPSTIEGRVTFDNLSFDEEQRDQQILSGFCADIGAGERVHLVGGSPSVSQALFESLLGERAPSAGRIRIDGAPVWKSALCRGQGGIVYLASAPVAFRGTVAENLSLFGLLPRDHCLAIARETGLTGALRRLPDGFETRLGKGALPHSIGFLQLVCLTRALCLSPRILAMDAATSSMDPSLRASCAMALDRQMQGKTVLIRTECAEIASLADRAIMLGLRSLADTHAAWDADLAEERSYLPDRQSA